MVTMRTKLITATFVFILFFSLGMATSSSADDAVVLPKGVASLNTEGQFYMPIDKRFNRDGHVEDSAIDYNANLNSTLFPALGFLELPPPNGFGMPAGSASLGNSVVKFKYDVTNLNILFAYGITDKLTVGVYIPYQWVTHEVNARVDNTNATVARNPFLGGADPFGGAPLVPIAVLKSPPFGFSDQDIEPLKLTTEDIQALLGNGLDIGNVHVPGFGYKRFETWSDSGLCDIEAGVKYQYLKNDNWRLAVGGGLRLPTGSLADIDSLQARAFGAGNWGLLFRLYNDYTGIKNLVLNTTLRYDHMLSAHKTFRVPPSVHEPITDIKETVDIRHGDIVEVEVSGKYELSKGLNFSALYKYGFAQKDEVIGSQGNILSLEDETDYTEHVYVIGLSYSTIPLYMEKKFPVPFTASIAYRNRFAGTNNIFKSQFISAALQFFF
jgi:hypothetical protein